MVIHGQRWRYRVGNADVCVDNAFSWWGWAQERWVINGEEVRSIGAWFTFRRKFDEPWLTPLGDGVLAADLRSAAHGVACEVRLDGELLAPEALYETSWSGRGAWPDEAAWVEVERHTIFAKFGGG
ncbi:MAG: hypothetical protein ACJLS3_07730 [Erythrobacter sp.]